MRRFALCALALAIQSTSIHAHSGHTHQHTQQTELNEWQDKISYKKGQRVTYQGAVYQAKWWSEGDLPATNTSGAWQFVQFMNGEGEVSNPWLHAQVYTKGQVVAYKGEIFKAKWWTLNEVPGASQVWEKIAHDKKNDPISQMSLIGHNIILNEQKAESPAGESLNNAFDGDPRTKYVTLKPQGWIQVSLAQPQSLTQYQFTSANDAPGRDPHNWTLKGSNDGENWQTIDQRNEQVFSKRFEQKTYQLSEEQPYQHYRFELTHKGTDDWGYDLLQIAELDLFTNTQLPIAGITSDSNTVFVGEIIEFQDASLNQPNSFEWQFEQGIPAASLAKNPLVSFKTPGVKNIELTTYNWHGQSELVTQQVKVVDPANPWQGFDYPEIKFAHEDTQSEGYKRIHRLFPDLEKTINDVTLQVNQYLYKHYGESPEFDSVTFSLKWMDTLAYRAGSGRNMEIAFSTKYITESLANASDEEVIYELLGVFWHELVHGYQHFPTGAMADGNEAHAIIEGIADLVRIRAGFHATRSPSPSKNWLGGYTNTGFFLSWIQDNYDDDFTYKINQMVLASQKEGWEWTLEEAIKRILNQDINILWQKYQATLGAAPEAPAIPDEQLSLITLGGEASATAVPADPIYDVTNAFDGDRYTKYLTLNAHSEITFSTFGAGQLEAYRLTVGENQPSRDPSSWTLYGSPDGTNWHQIDTQAHQVFEQRLETREFSVEPTQSFKHFKFNFTNSGSQSNGQSLFQIAEIDLLADKTTATLPVTLENFVLLGGEASAEHEGFSQWGEGYQSAFDGDRSNKYVALTKQGWLQFNTTQPRTLKAYSITSGNDAPERDPAQWTVSGSNDGVQWHTLDSRQSQQFESRNQTKTFRIENDTAYSQFRIELTHTATDANGNDLLQLSEIELFSAK
ncbi:basic secretory protein-like protein [Pseudoalteromonas luteoviolacea]|uniref:basic secretory protein-like protein n=1 Tax=Pseudoalteromonas luteoviolacea TaxID=43657 RepID=UPI001B364815|nr:basic secretory protein-like protein [Pseudoalteromonas luteoviolacea]MBQ4837754.1 discoidin domain-containing protein [Pseudoalteromonas luteoviolacea]